MSHLQELQKRFQSYLVSGDDRIEQDIISSENALAEHRLGVYYNAYRIRLIDCLAIDYAALKQHIGQENFEWLALDYLEKFPSKHPSVRWFGDRLPEYMREHYCGDDSEFLTELVDYECAQSFVFDAADSFRTVQIDDIAQILPEAWPELCFAFKPAIRWLDLYWNIPAIENAYDTNSEIPAAERSDFQVRWLLWRQDMKTHWRSLEVHEAWAIEQAATGASFAEICEGLLEWVDEARVALVGAGFMKQWVTDEILISLD